jgi:hypothetical protein
MTASTATTFHEIGCFDIAKRFRVTWSTGARRADGRHLATTDQRSVLEHVSSLGKRMATAALTVPDALLP